jgi:hypothetical protein
MNNQPVIHRRFVRFAVYVLAALAASCGAANAVVFPGACGFGVQTPAGTAGQVIRVTSLDAGGPGSLRAAAEAKGPRLVVFEIAGVIDLKGRTLRIREPFLTIAGQTAPSPGITLIGGGISISTHDVLIQHLRIRPGDRGGAKRSGWQPDALGTDAARDVVVDHCSLTWAVDENLSASGPRLSGPESTSRRITFSNCIVAEALHDSTHPKGPHSKGTLIHDCCRDIAIIGNLYAHNADRNPYYKAHTTGAVVNNVIYNPGRAGIQLTYSPAEWEGAPMRPVNPRVAIVGNLMLHGEDTRPGLPLVSGQFGDACMEDNLAFDRDGAPVEMKAEAINTLSAKPVWPDGLTALPASAALESVVGNAGARPWERDSTDRRIIRDLTTRKGRIIDSQDEVGGYPRTTPVTRPLFVPDLNRRAWLAGLARRVGQ